MKRSKLACTFKHETTNFCQNMEKAQFKREEMDGKVFFRQSWHFIFVVNVIEALFPIYTLTWRVNNYVSRQGKGIIRRNDNTIF